MYVRNLISLYLSSKKPCKTSIFLRFVVVVVVVVVFLRKTILAIPYARSEYFIISRA